jgi:hypothetical protein
LILSQGAGGVGLNLPSAKVVIDLAPWWNEAVSNQAIARACRAGTAGTVKIYTLSYGTVQEGLIQSAVAKKKLWKSYFFSKVEESEKYFMQAISKQVTKDADAFEKALGLLRFSKTALAPSLQALTLPQAPCATPPQDALQLNGTKAQILPLFCSGWEYTQAVKTAAAILGESANRQAIIDIVVCVKAMNAEAWQLFWNDPEKLLAALEPENQALIKKWITWTKASSFPHEGIYNEQVFTLLPELKCSKNILRPQATFTVRLLELQHGHYAIGVKL